MFHKVPSIVLAAAALAALTVTASAQTAARHRRPPVVAVPNDERPPLTVNRRSFLDPGPVAPVYSGTPNYVAQNTFFNRTSDQYFAKSLYGNDLLPEPLQVPGRPRPVVEFATPAYPPY